MMLGLATATMVESTRIMKNPTTIAHSAGHGLPTPVSPDDGNSVLVVVTHPSTIGPRFSRG